MSERLVHPLITPERLQLGALVYVRVSTPGQVVESAGSISLQRGQAELARAYGWPDSRIDVIDEDLGRSATEVDHRTGWQEMLRLIATGKYGAVFSKNAGRLSRDMRDSLDLFICAKIYNVALVIDDRPVDPNDPTDMFVIQLKAALAQLDNGIRAKALTDARREKARLGHVVCRMPVGWVKNPDRSLSKDPEVAPAIEDTIQTFWSVRTILQTVHTLDVARKKLPVRKRGGIEWKRPTFRAVRQILTHPAYAGFSVYGRTEARPDLTPRRRSTKPTTKKPQAVRRPLPESRWIKIRGHHPSYLTADERRRIQAILAENRFEIRPRAGNGPALCQGRLRCAKCKVKLHVWYPRKATYCYACCKNSTTYGSGHCIQLRGQDVDAAVEHIFLGVLAAPPLEMMRRALAEAHAGERAHEARTKTEHQRLIYEEQLAQERYDHCDAKNRRVAARLEKRLDAAIQEREEFESQLATAPPPPSIETTEEELRDLCAIASDVPRLWRDERVTNRERKALLQCLVETIDVAVSTETTSLEIVWVSGHRTLFQIWRKPAFHRFIRKRHAEGLTVSEICSWLKQGHPDNGQQWHITIGHLYGLLRKWGLTPNPALRSRRRKCAAAA